MMILKNKDVLCNFCGESCSLLSPPDPVDIGGLIDVEVRGGYNSTPGNGVGALDDSTAYSFSLCEFCLDYLFTQFKIPPNVSDYLDPRYPVEWFSAADKVIKDDWRNQKTEFFNEAEHRSELRCNFKKQQFKKRSWLDKFTAKVFGSILKVKAYLFF